jgi:hypothetical protein
VAKVVSRLTRTSRRTFAKRSTWPRSGAYWKDIGATLREAGVEQVPMRQSALGCPSRQRSSVKNPAYTGEARRGEYRNPDAHEAIVSPTLFERASQDHVE